MPSKHWMLGIVGLPLLSFVVGCTPYRPYGAGAYPGGLYATPPNAPGPSGGPTFAPPQQGSGPTTRQLPQTAPGGGSGSSPTSPSRGLGDAPPFDPKKDAVTPPKDNFVPEYRDPGEAEPFPSESSPRKSDGSATHDGLPFEESSTETRSPVGAESGGGVELRGIDDSQANADLGEDAFVPPIPLKPASDSRHREASGGPTEADGLGSSKTDPSGPNPYDYDRQGYTWLRGVVDYDPQTKTWNIIYDLRPSVDDEFGGSITLHGSPKLETLHNGDVVLVEGKVDRDVRDPFGKPRYRVEHLAGPLVPKR